MKLKSPSGLSKLQAMVQSNQCEIVSKYEYDPLVYFIKVTKNSNGNALDMANLFAASQSFEYAEPDFLLLLKKFNTNDPLLGYQWALNNTGSSIQYNGTVGADMKIFSAWGMSTGNAATKVAIIDEGVDLVHPDLAANILAGYDGTLQGSGGAPQGNDAHGTACAGIVAAVAKNNLGVAGIAYNSKIVPVRIAYGSGSSWITSNSWIGTSIDWAWNQGDADVLSNSWGGGSSSSLINDPISRAVTQGRGGLGAVVIFAAGNDNGAVSYPGTLTNVISVAAMSMCNQRKSTTSCDGETWWGSNYGTNVDVAAPGVKIHTTDISGSAGYSTGDYAPTFNGTSSACPNTAGVMALILALNPSLTQTQARQILESTCDKVGGYTYNASVSGQPNGTWSTELGYGRVNAFSALQLANPVPCTEPPAVATIVASPSSFCTAPTTISLSLSGITFGLGQAYQWQSSADNDLWVNITGANSQVYNPSVTQSTYFRCLVYCESMTPSNSVYIGYTDPTVTTYPHTENFDGSIGMPCGWSVQNVNGDANTWNNSTSSPRSAPNAMFYGYNVTNAADDWFFSAPLEMQAGTSYRVNFWYRAQSATYPERLEVKWGTSPSAAGMNASNIFANTNIINTTYASGVSSVFSPSTSGIYYIGFHINSLADMYNLMVDDVVIEIAPDCTVPNVGGTITGPLTQDVGFPEVYTLTGHTGTNIQWQSAVSPAGAYADVSGQTTASGIVGFTAAGDYLVRAKISSDNCVDAYSNVLTVTATCLTAYAGVASGPTTMVGGQAGTFTSTGLSGDIFNWQMSTDGGVTYTDIAGATQLSSSFTLPAGTVLVRFMSRYSTCTPAYSNVLTVVVTGPAGNTFADPIYITLPYTTTLSTAAGSGYTSNYTGANAQASPDVFFRFTTGPCADSLKISTCTGSTFDTYLHLLDATGTQIAVNDDNGPYCATTRASLKVAILPNTVYYLVVEGYSTTTGTFGLEITPIDNPLFTATITPANGETIACEGESIMLTASAGTQYLWSTGETTSFIHALETGSYSVTVQDANGCQALASIYVEFMPVLLWLYDLDGDGFGDDLNGYLSCFGGSPGMINTGGDCDDSNPNVYPEATEICNAVDDNCDQTTDEGFDNDGDGFTTCNGDCNDSYPWVNPSAQEICNGYDDNCNAQIDEGFDVDNDGYTSCNGDCNDNNNAIHPGVTELCDNVDNDCDSSIDEGFDTDGDGYTTCEGDCNDTNPNVHPGATEICNNINDDCDQSVDEGFDTDGDGYTTCNGDCDDQDPNIHPGATDVCGNGVNEDCIGNGLGDDAAFDNTFPDEISVACTADLFLLENPILLNACGDEEILVEHMALSGGCAGRVLRTIIAYRGAAVVSFFQQFVNLVDDTAPTITCPANITATANLLSNTATVNYTPTAIDDCTDVTVTSSHPSGSEFPVGVTTVTLTATDNCGNASTCTFTVTVNSILPTWYYEDADNDGFGNPAVSTLTNNPPSGYVTNNNDCDDNNINVNPTALEVCNGYDDNCDAVIDEGCCFITASAVATDAPCAGINNGSINLTVSNATNPVTYNWSNGATTEDISALAAGTYSVIVTDGNGCVANASASVANLGGTPPAAPTAIAGPNGVCRNSTGNVFSVAPIAGATSYIWTLPNGATGSSTTNSITLSFSASYVTGNLCVKAVNSCGMSANYCRSVLAFTSNPSIPGMISGPAASVCGGTTQTYSISAVTNASSYTWAVPATASIVSGQGTTSITVAFSASFTTSGTVSVRSVNCFGQSSNRSMSVFAIPGTPAAIVGETYGVCAGTTQTYSIPALAGAASYVWSVPAGAVINSGQGTTSINVTLPANFTSGVMSVRGQSNCGLGAARTKNIYSVPSISGVVSGQASGVCSGNYTYSITAPVGATSYSWTLPAGCTMVTNNGNSVVINVPSNFVSGSICVTATNGCGTSAAKCLALTGKPGTPAAITGSASVCAGQTGLVFSTTQVGTNTYTWAVPAGCTIVSGQGTNSVTVNWGSATGNITVKANTPCGSSANRSKSVAVVACMMEPENDSDPTVKFDANESFLRIYPNPNDGQFMIQSDIEGSFVIYNELGQVVKSFSLNNDNMYSQEIEGLSTGFYFIKGLNDQDGIVQKIVVTNK